VDSGAPGLSESTDQPEDTHPQPQSRVAVPSPGRLAVLGLLLIGLLIGGCLVITGGGSDEPGPTTVPSRPTPTLALSDLSLAGVESFSGVDVPDGAQDFLTARLDGDRQLDVTFTIDTDQVGALVSGSGLPPLAEGARPILHSSPLWKLNPGTPISGSADVRNGINRALEVTPEGERLRVRLTLQAV